MYELNNLEINYVNGGVGCWEAFSIIGTVLSYPIKKITGIDTTTAKIGLGIWVGLMVVEYVGSYIPIINYFTYPVASLIAVSAALLVGHTSKVIKQNKRK